MSYPNIQQRIEKELLAIRPFQSTFQVFQAGKEIYTEAMCIVNNQIRSNGIEKFSFLYTEAICDVNTQIRSNGIEMFGFLSQHNNVHICNF